MKIFKRIIFSLIFVSFASASLAETKMRITLQLPLKAHLGQNLLVFKKELESRSDIKVEIYDSAQLYKDKEVPQAVGSGAIEAGVASITRFAGTNPDLFQQILLLMLHQLQLHLTQQLVGLLCLYIAAPSHKSQL